MDLKHVLCAIVQFVLYDVKKESVYMDKQITKSREGLQNCCFLTECKKKNNLVLLIIEWDSAKSFGNNF